MTKRTHSIENKRSYSALAVLAFIVILAVVLQWPRLPFRWNPVAVAYAAYFHEFRHIISLEGVGAAFTTFVGLHPPAYSLFFLLLMEARAPASYWLVSSGLFSVAAVPLVWATARLASSVRQQPPIWLLLSAASAALVLAISPHRNAYGLEVNNYPLLVAVTAGQLFAFAKMITAKESETSILKPPEVLWVLATSLAIWTHVLSVALPCSQILLLSLLPEGRRRMTRVLTLSGGTALLCLPLLPAALAGVGSDPINEAPGMVRALSAAFVDFPGRYGSETASSMLAALVFLGAFNTLRLPQEERLIPLSWLAHGLACGVLILWMVASGMAADHQFPYYLALLPAGALLVSQAIQPGQAAPLRSVVVATLLTSLSLHMGSLGQDALRGQTAWNSANIDRGLVKVAVDSWTANSSLLLHGFPQTMDDDKDALDAAFSFIPMHERITFSQPEVATLVPGDPNWGQPLLFENGRWLYTFTDFQPERVEAITQAALARGERLVVAAYNTDWAQREADELRAWAGEHSVPGRRAKDQLLFILEPRSHQ